MAAAAAILQVFWFQQLLSSGGYEIRTHDLLNAIQALSQLS